MGLKSFLTNLLLRNKNGIETQSQETPKPEIKENEIIEPEIISEPEEPQEEIKSSLEPPPAPVKKKFGNQGVGAKRLQENEKQYIVSLFATGLTPSECVERAREEMNIIISPFAVIQYSKAEKWQPLIRKIRQATMNDLAAVAGSHKRVRLERTERVYEKAFKKGDLKHALAATENQRKEMEGGGDVNLTLNQFNMISDEELEIKKAAVLEKIAAMNKPKESS